MKTEVIRGEGGVNVVFDGNIDLSSVDEIRRSLEDVGRLGERRVVLDLNRVEFVDSAGLGALVTFYKSHPQSKIVFSRVNDRIRKLFQITRLDTLFQIE